MLSDKLCSKLLVGIAVILLSGCVPYSEFNYQVVSVKSPILNEASNNLTYENEDLRMSYDLWGNLGQLRYEVYNKTREILYIDLKRSFFVKNGFAYDYYVNKTETVSQGMSEKDVDIDIENKELESASYARSEQTAIESKGKIAIPPRTTKELAYFNVRNRLFTFCGLKKDPGRNDTAQIVFSANNTPFSFQNYLTYSLDQELKKSKEVNNQFWVYEIENYNGTNFSRKKEIQEPCDSTETYEVEVVEEKANNRFYIQYEDDPNY